MPRSLSQKQKRKWARLQLAIPVFVRTRDGNGKESLEFATAVNISPGGALVVVRRSLPKSCLKLSNRACQGFEELFARYAGKGGLGHPP